jgi:hypothetical protein
LNVKATDHDDSGQWIAWHRPCRYGGGTWRAICAAPSYDEALTLAYELTESGHIAVTPQGSEPASWLTDCGAGAQWD